MITQPQGTKQMTLPNWHYVKMKVYSNDYSGWTLSVWETEGRSQRVLCNLIFSDKLTNNPLILRSLSVWLLLALLCAHFTHLHTHTHTRTQTHSPAQRCQQSPLTVYHGSGNSSSVMYEKNGSKNKHENVDVTNTEHHHARLMLFYYSTAPTVRLKKKKRKVCNTGLSCETIIFRLFFSFTQIRLLLYRDHCYNTANHCSVRL